MEMTEMATGERILVLGIGNDIMGDDAAGLLAARSLRNKVPEGVEIAETSVGGFALMDLLQGYDKVLLLDVVTGVSTPGMIHRFSKEDFGTPLADTPHTVGLPEIFQLADRLKIPFPSDIRILALEVEDPYVIREGLTPGCASMLPEFIRQAGEIIDTWLR
jgi:hydrogenase maturation protease